MSNDSRMTHAADRLLAAVDRCAAPVCVGLDPVSERLPASLQPQQHDVSEIVRCISDFTRFVLDAVCEHVPCVKFQSACFERYGWQGVKAMLELITHARQRGMEVVLDAKRGDIGISAEHYAAAAFQSASQADWLTINAYLGSDGITPFLHPGCGAFALVRTSNPGGDALQGQPLASGGCIADAVAAIVAQLGAASVGERGYSSLGAVVGATKPTDAARLRALMPQQLFLVPGYGAQGAGVQDILPCFHTNAGVGTGAIVTASRSVIFAFDAASGNWQQGIADAAIAFADEIGSAVNLR